MKQILRVAILGAESTGKSTLAPALAAYYETQWVAEYLREFVEVHQRTPREEEQFLIASTQVAREEEAALTAQRFLFCDTTPLMTAIYSRFYWKRVDAPLQRLAAHRSYDFTIVTAPDAPWIADGLQRESAAVRQTIHHTLLDTLGDSAIAFALVRGDLHERVQQVVRYLEKVATDPAIGRKLPY